MLITQASLEALRTGFRTEFNTGLAAVSPQFQVITTTLPSATKLETYGFLGDFPVFREWVGEKRVKSLEEKAYQLTNRNFEASLGIHKHKIQDDNLGIYGPLVRGWAEDAGSLADRLAFEALANGHQRACYDGQNFFDTDHPMGPAGAATSNINAAAQVQPWYLLDTRKPLKPLLHQQREAPHFHMVTDPQDSHVFKTGEYLMGAEARAAVGYTWWQMAYRSTATLNQANYVAACQAMAAYTNDEGEPLGVKPTHIVVGVSNKVAARELFKKANLAGGESNIYFEDVAILEADRLP